ncbi:MAG: hypothetical protein M9891_01660 [Austwickia sp.]|nr:hypothetical protein [Actinomycetota bacterium]MCB1252941.1 hypothetical protein [Austwickia sp.]MCO5308000.1 hypothetical protein [Austwickia sp.]
MSSPQRPRRPGARRIPTEGLLRRRLPLVDPLLHSAKPVVAAMLGEGRRRDLVEGALSRLPVGPWRPVPVELAGWSAAEFLAYRAQLDPSVLPDRRAGHETVALINRLSASLPPQAVPVARSITDAAPPAGQPISPGLRDVLERYLPETLRAFNAEAPRELRGRAERLLTSQLDLLRDATTSLLRAQAENNDRDLRIQEAFLRDRFAELTPSALDLTEGAERADRPPSRFPVARPPVPRPPEPVRHPSLSLRPARGRVHVRPDQDPVVLFGFSHAADSRLALRLALPKGRVATLGVAYETTRGVVGFEHATNRKFLAVRRPTGFRSAQVDVNLRLDLGGLRRFLVYATSTAGEEPTSTVLFARSGQRAQADLPTLLTHDVRVPITLVASGSATRDGMLLRNESLVYPDLRSACTAFGFERVEWLDENTPIV